jgi:hypothetical protein
MPDSQLPPLWGPAYDERDLDALLTGDTAGTPVALQPVVSTLAALRAAATGRELSDEAAARAAFRAFATATVPPPGTVPPPPAGAAWTAAAEHPAVTAHTLILARPDDRRPSAGRRRHRHRRPAPSGVRKPGIAVTFAAAAALIVVVAAAVTGVLAGVGSFTSSFGRQPASASASARAARPSPGSQALLATGATSERTASPKTTGPAPATPRPTSDPGSMCRQYFEYFQHPVPAGAAGERSLYGQLVKLAGSGFKIVGYCLHLPDKPLAGKWPWPWPTGAFGGGHGPNGWQNPGTGSPGTGTGGQGGPSGVGDGRP